MWTMCESPIKSAKCKSATDTFSANVSNPRSVKGWIRNNSPARILLETSSSGADVNWDILPVVERKSENSEKRCKARNTCRSALKFDHVPKSVTTRSVRVWASSKAKMTRGSSSVLLTIPFACDLVLEPSVLGAKVGDAWCSLACKASSSLRHAMEGAKLYPLSLKCEGEV